MLSEIVLSYQGRCSSPKIRKEDYGESFLSPSDISEGTGKTAVESVPVKRSYGHEEIGCVDCCHTQG